MEDTLAASRPEEANYLIAEALSSGDLDAAVALYEPGGAFVPQPGQVVMGADLSEAVKGFIALKPNLQIEVTRVIEAGDIALLYSKWELDGTAPDGSPVKLAGKGTEVVRRQPDGTWLFVIDNPYGAE
jgi:ketosteroid isomerase-like protein